MHYRGIVDSRDAEWYDAVLDEHLSLDVNDLRMTLDPQHHIFPISCVVSNLLP
jgi:hypothetical protein